MPTFDLKIRKVKQYNPNAKKQGYITRAIINGTETFASVAEEASRNTTLNQYEMQAALGIAAQQFARALKNGFAIDLGPIGKIYPTVSSKWTELPEEQKKSDLKPSVRYDASAEIKEAVAGCRLSWEKASDEEVVEEEVVEEEEEEETPAPPSSGGAGSNPNPNPGGSTGSGGTNEPTVPGGSVAGGSGSNETPTDPTKILLLFNDGAHGNEIVKRMEVEPGYQLTAADLPEGYVYAFKADDQADIDAASPGDTVWVTLAPRG